MIGFSYGFQGRDTVSNDTPGASRYSEYVDSSGVNTGEPKRLVRLFNNTGASTVAGAVYLVAYGAPGKNPQVAVCTDTTPQVFLVAAEEVIANQAWGWFCIEGACDVFVEGTTDVAAGDFLKLVTATDADAFIKDGTAKTVDSFAIALAAQAANSAVLTKVWLIGDRADCD